jgi:TRAP-type C4-dicarboxylate transport system permease small subunit
VKVINAVSQWLGYTGVGLIVILMLLIVSNVFMRFVFNDPITGTPELAALTMACLALGAAWGALKGRHITVDIIIVHFAPRVQAIIGSITLLASIGIFALVSWRIFIEALWAMRTTAVASIQVPVPTYPFWWAYGLGFTMFCVAVVTILLRKIKGVKG